MKHLNIFALLMILSLPALAQTPTPIPNATETKNKLQLGYRKFTKTLREINTLIIWMLGKDKPQIAEVPVGEQIEFPYRDTYFASSAKPEINLPKPDIASDENLSKFYEQTLFDGSTNRFYQLVGTQDLASAIEAFKKNPNPGTSAWMAAMFPHYEIRRAYYNEGVLGGSYIPNAKGVLIQSVTGSQFGNLNQEQLKELLLDQKHTYAYKGATLADGSKQVISLPTPPPEISRTDFAKDADNQTIQYLACLRLARGNPILAKKCVAATKIITTYMAPVENLTALPAMQEVFVDDLYADGAARAAIKIMEKINSIKDPNIGQDFGNLREDVLTSFLELGLPEEKATRMTRTLLMVYAARGANIWMLEQYVDSLQDARLVLALQIIGSGLAVLDSVSYKTGHLYSLPKNITLHANYGKVYHYHMSQALAEMVAEQYGSETAAMMATMIAETGYQIFSNSDGREDLLFRVITSSPYASATNKIRLDLTIAYAGAIYGSVMNNRDRNLRFQINLDQVYRTALDKARDYRPLDVREGADLLAALKKESTKSNLSLSRAYVRWIQYVRPMGIWGAIRRQVSCNWSFHDFKDGEENPELLKEST